MTAPAEASPPDRGSGSAPAKRQRLSLRFVGQVQGVGFRMTTRACALRHGVRGWVRNESDGSVQADAPPS